MPVERNLLDTRIAKVSKDFNIFNASDAICQKHAVLGMQVSDIEKIVQQPAAHQVHQNLTSLHRKERYYGLSSCYLLKYYAMF